MILHFSTQKFLESSFFSHGVPKLLCPGVAFNFFKQGNKRKIVCLRSKIKNSCSNSLANVLLKLQHDPMCRLGRQSTVWDIPINGGKTFIMLGKNIFNVPFPKFVPICRSGQEMAKGETRDA